MEGPEPKIGESICGYSVINLSSELRETTVVNRIILQASLAAALLAAPISAAVIADEDFEGGATGWSDNTTTIGNATVGGNEFLGRFGGSGGAQDVFKTFALTGLQTQVTVSFDFFRLDTWDNESFNVFIDDVMVASDVFGLVEGAVPLNAVAITDFSDHGFYDGFFGADQLFRYTFLVATSATSIKLGFGATLDDPYLDDESYGIDNLLITDSVSDVPEPSSFLLFGTALLGWGAFVRKRKSGQA